jgi:hypothetical protein
LYIYYTRDFVGLVVIAIHRRRLFKWLAVK